MKSLVITFLFLCSLPAFSLQTESVELLNALANNPSDFNKLLKKSERILIYQTKMEVIDETKTVFQIFAKKLREGDILEGEVIWEIEKHTKPQPEGPDHIKYESHFINP
jgi:hypothetical protein